jgi:predicted metal-dependent peptidase
MAPESPIVARCRKQRSRLVGDKPWFGALSLRLGLHEEGLPRVDTAATDGTRLYVNPDWCGAQTDPVLRSVLKHEVLHCALEHPYRIGGRELALFNEAADHVVNLMLLAEGDELWEGALADPRFAGMAAEQVYAILERERRDAQRQQQQDQQQPGQGQGQDGQANQEPQEPQQGPQGQPQPQPGQQGQPGAPQQQPAGEPQPGQGQGQPQPGQFLPAPTGQPAPGEPERMSVEDWRVAVEQATRVDEKAGRMPGDIAEAVRAVREPRLDWVEILRRFVARVQPLNYAWSSPRRGLLSQGIYLPGMTKEGCPAIAVAVDTSGSISSDDLAVFAAECRAILAEVRPARVDVLYADTAVRREESYTPDGAPLEMVARGRGGTCFQPTLDRVTELIRDEDEPPACLIYLTDLDNSDRALVEPDYPVLWIRTARSRKPAPFGELVTMDEGDRR